MAGTKAQQFYEEKKIGYEDENEPIEKEVLLMREKGDNCRREALGM